MSCAVQTPDETRPKRPYGEPSTAISPWTIGSTQPIDVFSPCSNYVLSSSPSSRSTQLSAPNPNILAFTSPSSSNSSSNLPLFPDYSGYEDLIESMTTSPECQDLFSFELGSPVVVPCDPFMAFDDLNAPLAGLCINSGNEIPINGTVDNDGLYHSPDQSIANLPHLLASSYRIASISPTCHHCTLPIPVQPISAFEVRAVSFTTQGQHSIFILTSPPPPLTVHHASPSTAAYTPPPYPQHAGIYIYLSSTDLYFHSHPGPLPRHLPGFSAETSVGRIRNDSDPAIWLPTGAGGRGQDWLWAFRDMCRNMRMPSRDTMGWREMFREEDWVASVVELGRAHGILVGE